MSGTFAARALPAYKPKAAKDPANPARQNNEIND
jgi:hypothetical protein